MKLRIDTLGLLMASAVALTACPPKSEGPATEKKAAPSNAASQPAQPANVPTSTKAQGALEKGKTPETREQVDADGVLRRGTALSANKSMTLTEAFANADKLAGQTVKLTGKVDKVCEAMGCWFAITGDKPEERIRVSAKDHGFFVPTSAIGKRATVEGQLSIGKGAEGDDCAEEKSAHPGQKELSIEASAVEMIAQNS